MKKRTTTHSSTSKHHPSHPRKQTALRKSKHDYDHGDPLDIVKEADKLAIIKENSKYQIDSEDFSPIDFLVNVHSSSTREQLIGSLKMLEKKLDCKETDLKTLVNENFDKFVQSKDTVDQIHALIVQNEINAVGKGTKQLNLLFNDLHQKALSSYDCILKRSEQFKNAQKALEVAEHSRFILKFPSQITEAIDSGDVEQAVQTYRRVHTLLSASTDKLCVDVEKQCEEIANVLRKDLFDITSNLNESHSKISRAIRLLTQLNQNQSINAESFLSRNALQTFIEYHKKSLKTKLQSIHSKIGTLNERKNSVSRIHSPRLAQISAIIEKNEQPNVDVNVEQYANIKLERIRFLLSTFSSFVHMYTISFSFTPEYTNVTDIKRITLLKKNREKNETQDKKFERNDRRNGTKLRRRSSSETISKTNLLQTDIKLSAKDLHKHLSEFVDEFCESIVNEMKSVHNCHTNENRLILQTLNEIESKFDDYCISLPKDWTTQLNSALSSIKEEILTNLCEECINVANHFYKNRRFDSQENNTLNFITDDRKLTHDFARLLSEIVTTMKIVHNDRLKIISTITTALLSFADSIHFHSEKLLQSKQEEQTQTNEQMSSKFTNQTKSHSHLHMLVMLSDTEIVKNEIAPKLMKDVKLSEQSPDWEEVISSYNNLCIILLEHYITFRAIQIGDIIRRGIHTEGTYWNSHPLDVRIMPCVYSSLTLLIKVQDEVSHYAPSFTERVLKQLFFVLLQQMKNSVVKIQEITFPTVDQVQFDISFICKILHRFMSPVTKELAEHIPLVAENLATVSSRDKNTSKYLNRQSVEERTNRLNEALEQTRFIFSCFA